MKSFSSHFPACLTVGVRAQGQPRYTTLGAERVKGLAQGPNVGILLCCSCRVVVTHLSVMQNQTDMTECMCLHQYLTLTLTSIKKLIKKKTIIFHTHHQNTQHTHTHTKLTHTVVTDATVGSTRRAEDLAGVAVLQLHNLVVYLHVPDAGRRALSSRHIAIGCLCKTRRNWNTSMRRQVHSQAGMIARFNTE